MEENGGGSYLGEKTASRKIVGMVRINRSHKEESIGGVKDVRGRLTAANLWQKVWWWLCNVRLSIIILAISDRGKALGCVRYISSNKVFWSKVVARPEERRSGDGGARKWQRHWQFPEITNAFGWFFGDPRSVRRQGLLPTMRRRWWTWRHGKRRSGWRNMKVKNEGYARVENGVQLHEL